MWRADAHDTLPLYRRGAAGVPPMRRPSVPSPSGDAEALARTGPLLRYLVPRGAEEEFALLFGMRAEGLDEAWGRLSGWTLSRRLWAVAESCAGGVRPYASEVARGTPRGSLEALSRLPVELLRGMQAPALGALRARLEALLGQDAAVIGWPQLWEAWWEGGGQGSPWRVAVVLEALGVGMEPDPRLGRGSTEVALFALAEGASPGPEVPHRASRPLFALVAPVLAAAGLAAPPLPLWVTMVALSGIPAWDIPRMEAHLAYRMAARMRAGPVRAPLGDMGWEDRHRLGLALLEAVCDPGAAPAEGVLAALGGAYGLLGLHPRVLRRDLRARLGPEAPGDDPRAEEEEPAHRARRRPRKRPGVPAQVREAFEDWVRGGCRGEDLPVGGLGATRPLGSVLRSLARCSELLPPECCVALQVPDGSTYAEGARVIQDGIRAVQDVDAMLAPLYARWDVYDPSDPLGNLGWPVLIGGMLYRVDDEVLQGMQGQHDLSWEGLDLSEVLPAPPEAIAAERERRDRRAAGPAAAPGGQGEG